MASGIVTNIASSINFHDMLAQPFTAAAAAQAKMSGTTIDFINRFCLDQSGNVRTTTMTCNYDDPSGSITATDGSGLKQSKKALTVPLLSLLNVPSLQMNLITVDLAISIDQQTRSDTSNSLAMDASAGLDFSKMAGSGGIFGKMLSGVSASAKVSNTSSDTTSNSSQSKVKYLVHMEAANNPPAGLQTILNWLTSTTNPIAPNRTKENIGYQIPSINDMLR